MLAMQNMPESQKKGQTKKNTIKQSKKKTGTLESINKKLVSCLADLWPLKGVRHFEGIR